MFDIALGSLAADLIRELSNRDTLWEALILLAIVVIAKIAEFAVRHHQPGTSNAALLGHGGLKRLVFPLVALMLALICGETLKPFMHVKMFAIAAPLLASMAVIRCVFFVLRLTFKTSPWIVNFERMFATFVWCVVALHITGFLPEVVDLLESVSITIGQQQLNLWKILQGLFVVAIALLLAFWLGSLIESRLMRANGLDVNLQVVFSRLGKALLVLLAIIISLPMVGIDLTALSVFGGALGVGLGFGLQKIASNYVSGFILLLERSIHIGNTIGVGSDRGTVTQITTRYTVLRAGNGVEALVPNEQLIGNTVQNETYSDASMRYALTVQIGYQDDPERALALLEAQAKAHPNVAELPPPKAFLMNFGASGIDLELQFWLANSAVSSQTVRSEINLAIWKSFNAEGLHFPYPQQEVRILSDAPTEASS